MQGQLDTFAATTLVLFSQLENILRVYGIDPTCPDKVIFNTYGRGIRGFNCRKEFIQKNACLIWWFELQPQMEEPSCNLSLLTEDDGEIALYFNLKFANRENVFPRMEGEKDRYSQNIRIKQEPNMPADDMIEVVLNLDDAGDGLGKRFREIAAPLSSHIDEDGKSEETGFILAGKIIEFFLELTAEQSAK